MARLVWDSQQYETGLDRGVSYPPSGLAEAWNGLISVQESPSDDLSSVRYREGHKFHNSRRPGDFAGTIEAYTYPSSFYDFLFTRRQQPFHFTYRTKTAVGERIHLVYNVLTSPSESNYQMDEASAFSWGFTTTPVPVPGAKATAHLIVETSYTSEPIRTAFEDVLYGSTGVDARMPMPTEVLDIYEQHSILRVVDNGDGTFTITGPDDAIQMLDPNTFQITWPSAVYLDAETYTIRSL